MTDSAALTEDAVGDTVLSIDAMGGDLGPGAVVSGLSTAASQSPQLRFIVHGDGPERDHPGDGDPPRDGA